ncbi:MAG: ATP-binding protein [Armatimonadetes bacterium]|nr:ATP-binding protein [Armatimonadota bacterium]
MPEDLGTFSLDPGPPPTLKLQGEIDFRCTSRLQQALRQAAVHPGDVRVDLAEVSFVDSSGYAVLVEEATRLSGEKRRLELLSPGRAFLNTLNVAGLRHYFVIRNPSEAASVPPPPTSTVRGWQHSAFAIPCRVNLLSMARERVMAVAQSLYFSENELCEIELAAGEALSNALRHGCREEEQQIKVECVVDGSALTVQVNDPGHGFLPERIPMPDLEALQEGGMGIHFMRLMMDEITYRFDERGTTVEMTKRPKNLHPAPEERDNKGNSHPSS